MAHIFHFMGFSRQEYWSALPFPSPVDHILSDLSTMTRQSWVPHRAWLSFIELDQAVWLDWLVFCDYGFSVSSLWCPLATLTVLLGYLFTAAPANCSHCYLPWTRGNSSLPHHEKCWAERSTSWNQDCWEKYQ